MVILSKKQFFAMWEAGVLGNRPHLFRTFVDVLRVRPKEVGFRQLGVAGGGKWVKVPFAESGKVYLEWKRSGVPFIMDSGAADDHLTLQGEVCHAVGGWAGYMGWCRGLPMRKAMAAGRMRHCSPAEVVVLLQAYMDPSSRDDLEMLLEMYPDATVEFSCFDIDIGICRGRNTIFWETRNY